MPPNLFALKAALRDLDAKGIEVGDVVTVTWEVDPAYAMNGQRTMAQTGPLASLDRDTGWFEIAPTNASPGHLRSSITAMGSRMEKSGTADSQSPTTSNLFVSKAKKRNPFVEKAHGA